MFFNRFRRYLKRILFMKQLNFAMARASATSNLRQIYETNPSSWEFSGFSQNGEDGIIDFLCKKVINPNRYFVEIGSADGTENNTSFLALAKKYSGLMVDGDKEKILLARDLLSNQAHNVEFLNLFMDY